MVRAVGSSSWMCVVVSVLHVLVHSCLPACWGVGIQGDMIGTSGTQGKGRIICTCSGQQQQLAAVVPACTCQDVLGRLCCIMLPVSVDLLSSGLDPEHMCWSGALGRC